MIPRTFDDFLYMEIIKGEADQIEAICMKEGCRFKQKLHHYCGKHQVHWFREETKTLGLKPCVNDIRGCRVQNPLTYLRSKCAGCLEKDREIDHQKRKDLVKELNKKQCSACAQLLPLDQYQGVKGETKTCLRCRDSNKRADLKRDKERVKEIANKNAAKPERKEVKQAWKEKNPEKVASYWLDARKRLIEQDLEGYLKKNAEHAKHWRDANPEKVLENNKNKIMSMDTQYNVYKVSAATKQHNFEITKEEYTVLVKMPCYYCGILQSKGFNGIDRLDSRHPDIKDNCVSCCTMCNMMKGCLSPMIFVHRAEHILTYLKLEDGQLYPIEFSDTKGCSYSQYKNRSIRKKFDFTLSEELFYSIQERPCYLCGKEQTNIHKNGIDRYDNKKGYTEENIRSCCSNCNYMKKNYDYVSLLCKFKIIYEYQKIKPIRPNELIITNHIIAGHKRTKEEQKIIQENRKKEQRINLRERYTNEETRKEWISKLVKNKLETSK
jgi:hypothetical protein